MNVLLQRRFYPPIEHLAPKNNNIVVASKKHSHDTMSNVRSSWNDYIIRDVLPTLSYGNKTVATHSPWCHGTEQKLKSSTCAIVQHRKSLNTKKYFPCKDDKNTCSTISIDVPNNNVSQGAEISCTHVEKVVQIPCDASTEPVVLTIYHVSNGVSMFA
jgi:hypothetical protein